MATAAPARPVTSRVLELARVVWDYHQLNHVLELADVIILLV